MREERGFDNSHQAFSETVGSHDEELLQASLANLATAVVVHLATSSAAAATAAA